MGIGSFYFNIHFSGTLSVKGNHIYYIIAIGIEPLILCVSLLLVLCGDIEINPGPKMTVCPECKGSVTHIKTFVNVDSFVTKDMVTP